MASDAPDGAAEQGRPAGSALPDDRGGAGGMAGSEHVRRDMETIFGAAQPASGRETPVGPPEGILPIVTARSSERLKRSRARQALLLPGLVIAGTLAASIAFFHHGRPGPAHGQEARPVAAPATQVAQGQPAPSVARSPPETAAPAPASTPVSTPKTEAVAAAAPPADRPMPRVAPASPVARADRRADSAPFRRAVRREDVDGCRGHSRMALARCMRPNIVDADQELRAAYRDAVRAGVDRRTLIAYRREWTGLRTQALSNPRRVAAGYRDIAQRLDASHR